MDSLDGCIKLQKKQASSKKRTSVALVCYKNDDKGDIEWGEKEDKYWTRYLKKKVDT